jgi:hypothetical protein
VEAQGDPIALARSQQKPPVPTAPHKIRACNGEIQCGSSRISTPIATAQSPVLKPYIGSKIRLISKSEIRYQGVLYTINTKESTVALQNGQ